MTSRAGWAGQLGSLSSQRQAGGLQRRCKSLQPNIELVTAKERVCGAQKGPRGHGSWTAAGEFCQADDG
jgi:hypothetical protein